MKEGLDVAFYKGRSRYHTKWDAPAYTDGGEKSLWAMIDVARGVGVGLLNPEDVKPKSKPGVYLDREYSSESSRRSSNNIFYQSSKPR